jgi:tetratricopeptide (TPR) repeat protein
LELALESGLKNLGEDHPNVATYRFSLASVHEAAGELERAIALLEVVVRSFLSSLGSEHPSLAYSRAKLASLLLRTGHAERARQEMREALRVARKQPEGAQMRDRVEKLAAGFDGGAEEA